MRPLILQLDDSLDRQGALGCMMKEDGGQVLAARDLGPALRRRLGEIASPAAEGIVAFAGSGDFHHVTSLLIERAAARAGGPLT
ncbi:MAG: hypothetical protein ACHP7A_08410, partial [Caulobacterales bacterium]